MTVPGFGLVHVIGRRLDVSWRGRPLLSYSYGDPTDPRESPKPFLHPVRTLGGEVVTGFRPYDHPWHKGIAMTAHLSGQNFWGGETYVPERGYVQLRNNGRMDHRAWKELTADGDRLRLAERLVWRSVDDEPWVAEQRTIDVPFIDAAAGRYALSFGLQLRNVSGRDLEFTSPATEGLTGSGYGGLFWRGPRSFIGGTVRAGDGIDGAEQAMAFRSPWLAYAGRHDVSLGSSTLVFVDDPGNPGYPNEWFVRAEPIPCVCFPLAYSAALAFPADGTLSLRYGIAVADGALDRAEAEALAETLGSSSRAGAPA